jgi:hypothetical protein
MVKHERIIVCAETDTAENARMNIDTNAKFWFYCGVLMKNVTWTFCEYEYANWNYGSHERLSGNGKMGVLVWRKNKKIADK